MTQLGTDTPGLPPDLSPPSRYKRARGRAGTVMAWGLLAAVILSAGIWVFAPTPDGPGNTPGAAPADVASTDSSCGLADGDQNIPAATPADTTWQTVGTMAAPTDPAIGPGRADPSNGLPYCYARSPIGVLYAVANFSAVCTDPSLRLAAMQYLTAAGPGRDRALSITAVAGVGGPGSSDIQIAGFRMINYDPNSASVDMAYRFGTQYVHIAFGFRWEAGDWKVVLPDSGAPFENAAPLADLRDYVPWAGR